MSRKGHLFILNVLDGVVRWMSWIIRFYPAMQAFPGHSMAAWALFTMTAAMIRKTWVSLLCLFLAVSVAVSRAYLMAHFLRAVIARAAVGFSIGFAMFMIYANWMKKNRLLQEFARVKEARKT